MDGHADFSLKISTLMAMLIFSQKINMDGHTDFYTKKQHGRPC